MLATANFARFEINLGHKLLKNAVIKEEIALDLDFKRTMQPSAELSTDIQQKRVNNVVAAHMDRQPNAAYAEPNPQPLAFAPLSVPFSGNNKNRCFNSDSLCPPQPEADTNSFKKAICGIDNSSIPAGSKATSLKPSESMMKFTLPTWLSTRFQSGRNMDNISNKFDLHLACSRGDTQAAQLLLDRGVDLHTKDKSEYTALDLASRGGHADLIQLLLERGADIYAKNSRGYTALHWACTCGHAQLAQLLLDRGADSHSLGVTYYFYKKTVKDIIDRWPATMAILCLQEIHIYNFVDLSLPDLIEFIGQ